MNGEPEAIETGVRLMRSGDSLAALATFDAAIAAQPGLAVAHYTSPWNG